jgi:Ribosomal protein L7/L12 C-terminal domain
MRRRRDYGTKKEKVEGEAAGGDRYDVMLTGGGDERLAVAKVFNEISGMRRVGAELQEIFSRPTPIKEGVAKDEAAQIKRRIEDAGGSRPREIASIQHASRRQMTVPGEVPMRRSFVLGAKPPALCRIHTIVEDFEEFTRQIGTVYRVTCWAHPSTY